MEMEGSWVGEVSKGVDDMVVVEEATGVEVDIGGRVGIVVEMVTREVEMVMEGVEMGTGEVVAGEVMGSTEVDMEDSRDGITTGVLKYAYVCAILEPCLIAGLILCKESLFLCILGILVLNCSR